MTTKSPSPIYKEIAENIVIKIVIQLREIELEIIERSSFKKDVIEMAIAGAYLMRAKSLVGTGEFLDILEQIIKEEKGLQK